MRLVADTLSARELAQVIGFVALLVFGLTRHEVRGSLVSLIRTMAKPWPLGQAVLSLTWNAGAVYLLFRLGLWAPALWWDTATFVLIGSTALVWKMTDSTDFSLRFYLGLAGQALGLSVLLGTVASTNTFSLPVELVLLLWLALLGGMKGLSDSRDEYQLLRKPLNLLIGATSLAMLAQAISGVVRDYHDFLSINTMRLLLLLFLLTAAYLPFLFLTRVFMTYQVAFAPLKLGERKRFSIRLYARLRMIGRFRLNLARLHKFRTSGGNELRFVQTRQDVDSVLVAV